MCVSLRRKNNQEGYKCSESFPERDLKPKRLRTLLHLTLGWSNSKCQKCNMKYHWRVVKMQEKVLRYFTCYREKLTNFERSDNIVISKANDDFSTCQERSYLQIIKENLTQRALIKLVKSTVPWVIAHNGTLKRLNLTSILCCKIALGVVMYLIIT